VPDLKPPRLVGGERETLHTERLWILDRFAADDAVGPDDAIAPDDTLAAADSARGSAHADQR
jgi:hypothetical protein